MNAPVDSTQPHGRLSPLDDVHRAGGASFTDFAGWQMPVRYSSELEEHHAVRTAAGLFDLSHMAEILVKGPGAGAALDYALCGVFSTLAVGQARYSLLLTTDGGIIDDVIVYRTHEHRFGVVANAGNRAQAAGALSVRTAGFDATVVDESDALALIAVQGPMSQAIMAKLPDLHLPTPVADLRYYWSTTGAWRGEEIMVARTGYTGEDGFELYILAEHGASLWSALLAAGEEFGLVPAGLACRDTLRLEAGMPLYGHELSLDTLPQQVGLGRIVKLAQKGEFVGRGAVAHGPSSDAPVLVGLTSDGRRAGRAGYPVLAAEGGEPVGVVTSGALSPTLGFPIALALVSPSRAEPGTELVIDVRGKPMPAVVTSLPFYKRPTTD
ncbi:glycine cleavage system aminomethyltransferase GcvT [Salinibacterium hongtaonis]|nr:glycine cleavage system aminomethyltransferase GcvT [Salinibacterium hongtaonis]AWB90664.1 glycine cleavage system aminomethyltransferase GcvT [Salinibacterium hongtaonis]